MHCLEKHVVLCTGLVMAGIWVIWDHIAPVWGLSEESSSIPTGVSKGMIGPRRATSWAHKPVDVFHVRLLESMTEPTVVPCSDQHWTMDGFLKPIWFPCRHLWDHWNPKKLCCKKLTNPQWTIKKWHSEVTTSPGELQPTKAIFVLCICTDEIQLADHSRKIVSSLIYIKHERSNYTVLKGGKATMSLHSSLSCQLIHGF